MPVDFVSGKLFPVTTIFAMHFHEFFLLKGSAFLV